MKPFSSALAAYDSLLKRISKIERKLIRKYRKQIACSKGCFECCILGTVFAVEGTVIRKALAGLAVKQKQRLAARNKGRGAGYCPLLDNGSCAVYSSRPVICRTHGYPLLIGGKVSFCTMNFKTAKSIRSDCITDLDRLNLALAAINIAFMKETGLEKARLSLKSILREAACD